MKKKISKKYPLNAKITKGNCVRCSGPFEAHRNDAMYCSDLCRVQDSNSRKEKGYTQLVFKGTKKGLEDFIETPVKDTYMVFYKPYHKGEIEKTKKIILTNGEDKSWTEDSNDFRLYHSAHNKKNPFQLYYTESKYTSWASNSGKIASDMKKLLAEMEGQSNVSALSRTP